METPNFFEQAANISKAHGYDILAKQVGELKQIIKSLIQEGELDDLEFTNPADTLSFKELIKKAKIASL